MDRLTPIKENTAKTLRADLAVSETAVQAILKGDAQFVYALTTEPGHHSGPRSYGGYCFINQAAVCADLLAKAGKFKRVGLLDVDFHSGNGSLAIFYEREDVFFASLHMNPDLDYPYNCGFADQRGEGKGAGWTINVPLNCGVTWPVYRVEMLKVLDSFKAAGCDCLVVSLGLDTVSGDPEASPIATMELKVPDYLEMGEIIRKFNKPTIFVQEGGYRLEVVAEAARNVVDPQAGREEYQNKQ